MHKHLHLAFALIASVLLVPNVFADEVIVTDTVVLNKYPVLSGDEMKQIPFRASMPENYSPAGVNWELHNPFRDKTIAGIVVTVEYRLPSADKPTVIDVFIRVNCGPLQSSNGQEGCFGAKEAMKASPTIRLKEVHYTPDNT